MKLLEPFQLGSLTLSNRMVMAPMTRNRAFGTVPQQVNITYYRQRASAGLIISEGIQISPRGQGYPNTPGLYTSEQIKAWGEITNAVHENGGHIFAQLWHVGRISHSSFHDGKPPVAPSAIRPQGKTFTADGQRVPYETPHALEAEDIARVVEQFRQAAAHAQEAGFDGIELHGANGYLIDQFLQSGTNHRTDRYGGSAENRVRFLQEVIEAVTDVWKNRRVGIRLSPGGTFNDIHDANTEETFSLAARLLNNYDLAYLHLVNKKLNQGQKASALLRPIYHGTLVAAGGYDRESGEQALQENQADLIAYARLFLANPDLPERFAQNAPLNEWDRETFYGGSEEGYTDYPTLEESPNQ